MSRAAGKLGRSSSVEGRAMSRMTISLGTFQTFATHLLSARRSLMVALKHQGSYHQLALRLCGQADAGSPTGRSHGETTPEST
jgi:hypothetical protein